MEYDLVKILAGQDTLDNHVSAMNDFVEWWGENGIILQEHKEILQAGDHYIAQQAFLAGRME